MFSYTCRVPCWVRASLVGTNIKFSSGDYGNIHIWFKNDMLQSRGRTNANLTCATVFDWHISTCVHMHIRKSREGDNRASLLDAKRQQFWTMAKTANMCTPLGWNIKRAHWHVLVLHLHCIYICIICSYWLLGIILLRTIVYKFDSLLFYPSTHSLEMKIWIICSSDRPVMMRMAYSIGRTKLFLISFTSYCSVKLGSITVWVGWKCPNSINGTTIFFDYRFDFWSFGLCDFTVTTRWKITWRIKRKYKLVSICFPLIIH